MKRKRFSPGLERLEDRTVPSLDFGQAFSMGGGASSGNGGIAIASDADSNLYVLGHFAESIDVDPGPGTYTLTKASGPVPKHDFFVAKYTATGGLVWAQNMGDLLHLGGMPGDLAVDAAGSVYVTGTFAETKTFGSFTLSAAGKVDVFIAKLDTAGNFLWAAQVGAADDYSTEAEQGQGIAVDGAGNVYTTGRLRSQTSIFVSKHDANGSLVWLKEMTGSVNDQTGYDIARDTAGNLYVTGAYTGTVDFDPGPGTYNLTSVKNGATASRDIFALKLDAAGNFVWAGSLGGKGDDYGLSLALDSSANVHIAGHFGRTVSGGTAPGSADFDPGKGTYSLTSAGSSDAFVVKLASDRSFLWARRMGGSGSDIANSIAVDSSGTVSTTGGFGMVSGSSAGTSADFDPGAGTFALTSAGYNDVFVSQLSSAGNFVWAGRMGGTGDDRGFGLALDGSGNVFTTGDFEATADFDPGLGAYNLTAINPYGDVFVSKLVPSGALSEAGSATSELSADWVAAVDFVLSQEAPSKRKR